MTPATDAGSGNGGGTTLLYAAQVSPNPLTVSHPHADATRGSVEVIVTNGGTEPIDVTRITFAFRIGAEGALSPTTEGIKWGISDTVGWEVEPPEMTPQVVDGIVHFSIGPKTGDHVTMPDGTSIVFQVYDFATVLAPGTTAVTIAETLAGGVEGSTGFTVTTFPAGFYFDGLAARAVVGSTLVPVAEVPKDARVTLTWNASVTDIHAVKIHHSGSAEPLTPSLLGEWESPPLVRDTVFVVVVSATARGGSPLSAALSTAVTVEKPALTVTSIDLGGHDLAATLTEMSRWLVPAGTITMWGGYTTDVPQGWVLCDGANGTPDLRDKFVLGAGSANTPPGTQGGAASHGHSASTKVTIDAIGDHTHKMPEPWYANLAGKDGPVNVVDYNTRPRDTWISQGGGGHTHTATVGVTVGSTQHLPPFYALCFIQRTGYKGPAPKIDPRVDPPVDPPVYPSAEEIRRRIEEAMKKGPFR